MSLDLLLTEMKIMFDHRLSKLALKKEFEERKWQNNETFSDYYHEKTIIGNQVEKEEMIDHLIDGITDLQLQN